MSSTQTAERLQRRPRRSVQAEAARVQDLAIRVGADSAELHEVAVSKPRGGREYLVEMRVEPGRVGFVRVSNVSADDAGVSRSAPEGLPSGPIVVDLFERFDESPRGVVGLAITALRSVVEWVRPPTMDQVVAYLFADAWNARAGSTKYQRLFDAAVQSAFQFAGSRELVPGLLDALGDKEAIAAFMDRVVEVQGVHAALELGLADPLRRQLLLSIDRHIGERIEAEHVRLFDAPPEDIRNLVWEYLRQYPLDVRCRQGWVARRIYPDERFDLRVQSAETVASALQVSRRADLVALSEPAAVFAHSSLWIAVSTLQATLVELPAFAAHPHRDALLEPYRSEAAITDEVRALGDNGFIDVPVPVPAWR